MFESEVPNRLMDLMFGATFLIAVGVLKAYLIPWSVRERGIVYNGAATQRQRYFWLGSATAICWLPVIYLIIRFGWHDFVAATAEWWNAVPVFGWMVAGLTWFGLFSPLWSLVTAIYVYRHPSRMAHRVRGGWVQTSDVRQGVSPLPIYEKDYMAIDVYGRDALHLPSGFRRKL